MVEELMVRVDRIIASACFEPGNGGGGSGTPPQQPPVEGGGGDEGCSNIKKSTHSYEKNNKKKKNGGVGEGIECRICQEEGEESDIEAPCACNGTLKFAHRKCVQRWCNKKGDITCEICNQVYAPNYSIPQNRISSDVMAIDMSSHFLAIAAAEQELLHAEYEEYAAANNSGLTCCRSVALTSVLLLLARHVLLVMRDSGIVQDASAFFNITLQFAGFLLPCYVIARSCYIILKRRRHQV